MQYAVQATTCGSQFRSAEGKRYWSLLFLFVPANTLPGTAVRRRLTLLCFLHKKYTHSSDIVHPPLFDDDLPNEHISFSLKLRDGIRDRPLVHIVGRRSDDRYSKLSRVATTKTRLPADSTDQKSPYTSMIQSTD